MSTSNLSLPLPSPPLPYPTHPIHLSPPPQKKEKKKERKKHTHTSFWANSIPDFISCRQTDLSHHRQRTAWQADSNIINSQQPVMTSPVLLSDSSKLTSKIPKLSQIPTPWQPVSRIHISCFLSISKCSATWNFNSITILGINWQSDIYKTTAVVIYWL